MDHIVVNIQPFLANQEVCVYQDGKCVKTTKCILKDIDKTCAALCKEYNIHQVDIGGLKVFAKKIESMIKSSKFEDFDIDVTVH